MQEMIQDRHVYLLTGGYMKAHRTTLWVATVIMALLPTIIMARMQEGISATMVSISRTEVCYFNTLSKIDIAFEGQPPFRVVYTDGTQEYTMEAMENNLIVFVQPLITTTYSLVSVQDNSGEFGVVSGSQTLTVYPAPTIVEDLSSTPTYACSGETVTMHIEAEGWNVTYQWYKDGEAITDNTTAVTATLLLPSFMPEDSAVYQCRISGNCIDGQVYSVNHPIMPSVPVQITEDVQPGLRQICTGSPMMAHVSAEGTDVYYQWRRNGFAIDGANNATLVIAAASSQDVGVYDCMVNARCYPSPLFSSSFSLLLDVPIGIVSQPESLVSCQGQEAQFAVTNYGSEPIYRWFKDGQELLGNSSALTPVLTINPVSDSNAGTYQLQIGTRCSEISVLSDAVELTVLPLPAFVEVPASVSMCERGNIALHARATGVDVRYQWLRDNQEINGATDSTLYLFDVMPEVNGKYSVRVMDVCASLESEQVDVTIVSPIRITEQPHPVTVCAQNPVLLSVTATGSTGIYEWFKDGVPVAIWNTPEFRIESADVGSAGVYTCKLTGATECQPREVFTEPARVIVLTTPEITTQTHVAYAALHGEAVMKVEISASDQGDAYRTYQWYADGAALTDDMKFMGTNSMKLIIRSVGVHDAQRVYTCRVNGMCGVVWSQAIHLVIPPITILQEPRDAKICYGMSAQVSIVAVTDEGVPLTYQWLRNGEAIKGATSSTLSMNSFTDLDNGVYLVRMNLGDNVFVESRSATLLALHAPRFVNPDEYKSLFLCPGTYFGLTARMAEGNDLKYQWYQNAVPIEGANQEVYVEYALTYSSAGQYALRVYNDCGVIERTVVNLMVLPETEITLQPVSEVVVREGSMLTLTAEGHGDKVQYQWERNGNLIEGATNAKFAKVAAPADAGSYRVRVMGTCGMVVSNPSLVLVNSISGIDDNDAAGWRVGPCVPQPVLDKCVINMTAAAPAHVRIVLVDMFGREVVVLRDETMDAGSHAVVFDAAERGLSSGRYTVVLSSSLGHHISTPVMIVR